MRLEVGIATYPLERPNHVLGVMVRAPTGGRPIPTWLMVIRVGWKDIKLAREGDSKAHGWPVSFAIHEGNLELWPWPDADYELEVRQFPAYKTLDEGPLPPHP